MALLKDKKFDFVSDALGPDDFGVLYFTGTEGISQTYRFEIDLVSQKADIDLQAVIQSACRLSILRDGGDIVFNGILAAFDQMQMIDGYAFYRAVLVPRLERLKYTRHNQVFLNQATPDILKAVLKDGGLAATDFDFQTYGDYAAWEYVCQYRETHFEFVSRWMEREGMYYFFEQGGSAEKLIVTDAGNAHVPMPQGKTLHYVAPSALTDQVREETIYSLVCRQNMLPQKIKLKDYNYRTPSLEIEGEAPVSAKGAGTVYIYGEHFRTPEEGKSLAKIRADELLCRERVFHGESLVPYLRPGYVFDLVDHFRDDFNQSYLTVALEHTGNQTAYMADGVQSVLSVHEERAYYRNSFTLIPSRLQFRPERKTDKPRFYGTLNAKVDAESTGKYAELDDQGRYKVRLPFDLAGEAGGKASSWLRMAQPYAGENYGLHFPLHKGTEVLLTFIDGDPDRPLINAAVPNPATPGPVASKNETMNVIHTSGKNRLEMEDQAGAERVKLYSPTAESFVQLGAHGEEEDNVVIETEGTGLIKTGKYLKIETGEAETEGTPADGDFHVTTAASYIQKTEKNYTLEVAKNYKAEIGPGSKEPTREVTVTGDDEEHITGKQDIKVDGKQEITVKGEQEVKLKGGRKTEITGEDEETVEGSRKTVVKEKWDITVEGDSKMFKNASGWEWTTGAASEGFGGASFELVLGIKAEIFIGPKLEIDIGIPKLELGFAMGIALQASFMMEANFGGAICLHEAIKLNKEGLEVHAVEFVVEDKKIKFENENLSLVNDTLHIKT